MGKHVLHGTTLMMDPPRYDTDAAGQSQSASVESATRQRKGPGKGGRFLFYLTLAVLGVALAAGAFWLTLRNTGIAKPPPEPVNLLILGVDVREHDSGRTDTIMVVGLNPKAGIARVVSLPRDTRVQIPGHYGHDKLNAVYGVGGPKLTQTVVQDLLGIKIKYYLLADFKGFERAVNALGGVQLDVQDQMDYDDNAQDLHIHLKPGRQVLSGRQALGYVRYRNDGLGDVSLVDPVNKLYEGRVKRQQAFVEALAAQALIPRNVWRLPGVARAIVGSVDTDMPLSVIVEYARAVREMSAGSLTTELLPGSGDTIGGVSYWVPDDAGVAAVAQRMRALPDAAVPEQKPKSVLPRLSLPVFKAHEAEPPEEPATYRVEVLNGSGVPGLAKKAADLLPKEGFVTVRVGNADRFDYAHTTVYSYHPGRSGMKALEKAFGDLSFEERSAEGKDVDFTVILGQDFSR